MYDSTTEMPTLHGKSKRVVVAALSASLAFQALAFAVPGDAYSLLYRGIGVALLVTALIVVAKGSGKGRFIVPFGIAVTAGLVAFLAATQINGVTLG